MVCHWSCNTANTCHNSLLLIIVCHHIVLHFWLLSNLCLPGWSLSEASHQWLINYTKENRENCIRESVLLYICGIFYLNWLARLRSFAKYEFKNRKIHKNYNVGKVYFNNIGRTKARNHFNFLSTSNIWHMQKEWLRRKLTSKKKGNNLWNLKSI